MLIDGNVESDDSGDSTDSTGDFEQGCVSTVVTLETRLECFIQVVGQEVLLDLN